MEKLNSMLTTEVIDQIHQLGSRDNPILDSSHSSTIIGTCAGLKCPASILDSQQLVPLDYLGFDGLYHRGQLVIHEALVWDVTKVFDLMLELCFPIASLIPIGDPRFLVGDQPSDDLSMALNNSSGFHYRYKTGQKKLSTHAKGLALDINPKLNPYIKGEVVLPENAQYSPEQEGSLHPQHEVVKEFKNLGWIWGGDWVSLKDFQHFEKSIFPIS